MGVRIESQFLVQPFFGLRLQINQVLLIRSSDRPVNLALPRLYGILSTPSIDIDFSARPIVGERSNFKKIPTRTQDHGDA